MIVSVILAAGEGTRMKSDISKLCHTLLRKPMLNYVATASSKAGIEKNIVIVNEKNRPIIEQTIEIPNAVFEIQRIGEGIPYGTGYAVKLGMGHVSDEDQVLILNGDIPLLKAESLRSLIEHHLASGAAGTLMTAFMDDPYGYGRIVKDEEGYLKAIVEHRDADEKTLAIKEWNPGIYLFNGKLLKEALEELDADNDQGELYITDVVHILSTRGHKLATYPVEDAGEVFGINSKDQLAEAEELLRKRVNTEYMKQGVIMENPATILIEPGVAIGRDTRIGMGVSITGRTSIGAHCSITGDTHIHNAQIGDRVVIRSSDIESSEVGDDTDIGPYARLRPGAVLGQQVHIGNFVEVKNSKMGNKTKAGHLAYIGDADLGADINVGCGVVFVNYDGVKKHRSTVEDGAFIGSNANIVSPVHIETDGFVAAGSTITRDVEKGALAITRPEEKHILDWVYIKKKKH